MIITYHGGQFFKIQFGNTVIGVNPPSKESSIGTSRFGADIALVSSWHQDFNGVESLSFGEKNPFVISGPGEYDVKGVFVKGLPSHSSYDKQESVNTIYLVTLEDMQLCFLGALSDKELSPEAYEALDDVGILFVTLGGGLLSPAEIYKLSVSLEPSLIIPAELPSSGKDLKTFLKEGGEESLAPVEKLTLKRKDLEGKEGDIALLSRYA
ncbi:MAG: MBL fold metallo-hydrolase [Patescibacteria group bacterium]